MNSPEELIKARVGFIDAVYPKLFGEDEMGNPAAAFEPTDITGILAAYEGCWAANGLLNVINEGKEK